MTAPIAVQLSYMAFKADACGRKIYMSFDREDTIFNVVVNHEEQYSIWPTYKAVPPGWTKVGVSGDKKLCVAYIDKIWTDMRPLSLRKSMEASAVKLQ
jgi:MbtH protein